MKTKFKKLGMFSALLITLLLLGSQVALSGEYEKYIERKFDVNKNATLMVKNKFGDVHCQVWDKLQVSIKVDIIVDAGSEEKADKVFDRINVEIGGDKNKVTGITEIGKMSMNNVDFSVDYYIMMPNSLNLELNNSFGELFVEEVNGPAIINLEYGEMEINALNGTGNELTLKFSEGSLDYINEGKIRIEYGGVDIEGANILDVHSRFSEVSIEKSGSLVLDSQYDDISLDDIGDLDFLGRFTDMEVDNLMGNFYFNVEYGETDIDYISKEFSEGEITASFANFSLTFDPKVSFQVDADMKFCELHYPGNSSVKHREESYVNNLYKGIIGSDESTTANLVINSKNGDVDISFK
jgi:hypothetical protein